MKLYGDPGSGSTRRVFAALYHIGVEFDFELIDLFKGDNRTPAFLALNPNGMIPVLVDGDVVLWEASAINLHLAEKFGSDLLPPGAERALTLQWMFWAAEHWRQGPPALFGERIAKVVMGVAQDPRVIADAEASIRKFAAILDAHLEDRRYVIGNKVSLADFDLAATFTHLTRTHPPYAEFPNVMAWHQRLLDEVPAWARTRDEVEVRMAALLAPPGGAQ
ncbi:glutathione S-transferase family protein [Duganella aceris]|uniref:Glutathione S-transferase family protein n=1 Tax=Duganella aceris TaxID=2703883 RepID=A0ABX0FL80_9BURK|nr:glutathione S-transferase family protein [Duganella aceris]NGZ85262.1 glutathione S-transferase family protein [Duganella aceris]